MNGERLTLCRIDEHLAIDLAKSAGEWGVVWKLMEY